jgi:hydrogenase maturation protein HypF
MLGLGSYNHFEAQLPMALEAIIGSDNEENYDFELKKIAGKPLQFDLYKMMVQIINDIQKDTPDGIISVKFHNTIAATLLQAAKAARESKNLNTVTLSGGVFCNRYLTNRLIKLLKKNDFTVLFHRNVPANDGGISLGQAAIAAKLTKSES